MACSFVISWKQTTYKWMFLYFALTSLATVENCSCSASTSIRQRGLKLPQNHPLTRINRLLHPPCLKVCLGLCTVAITWQVRSISEMALLFIPLKLAGLHNQFSLLTMVQVNKRGQTIKSDSQSSFLKSENTPSNYALVRRTTTTTTTKRITSYILRIKIIIITSVIVCTLRIRQN